MELKDYLHFYMGCKAKYIGMANIRTLTPVWMASLIEKEKPLKNVRPFLRPLSSMTVEEAILIVITIYKEIYGYYTDTSDHQLIEGNNNNKIGFTCKDEEGEIIGLTIDTTRGIEFSVNGSMLIVRQFDITKLLLDKYFDLFGLIEADLAIDSTTLKQSV